MSGTTAHSAPAPESEEEQEEQGLDEKKAQAELEQTLQAEVPELQQGQFTAQILGGLFLLKTKGFQDVKTAFETLKDPKLTDNLFDFEHPENLQQARSSVRVADRELRKKESVNKGRAETRFLFWKQDLTPQQFRRAVFETVVARRVDRIVNTEERNIRFRNAVNIYGISDEAQFSTSVQQWLKNNPGRNLDDAYATVGAQFTGLGKDEAKEKKRALEEEQKKARGQAIANKKEVIARGKKIASGFHDGTRDTTLRNLSEGLEFGEKGISPKQLSKGFSEIPVELADEIMGYASAKQPPTPQPKPAVVPAPPARPAQQPVIPKISLPRFSFPSGLGNFFRPVSSFISSGLTKIGGSLLKSGAGFLGKQALIKGLGGVLSGGTLTALSAASDALKRLSFGLIDVEGWTLRAAGLAVLAIVAIFILIIIGTDSLFSTNTASNPMIIPQTAQSQTQSYNWQEFEEKYLTRTYSP